MAKFLLKDFSAHTQLSACVTLNQMHLFLYCFTPDGWGYLQGRRVLNPQPSVLETGALSPVLSGFAMRQRATIHSRKRLRPIHDIRLGDFSILKIERPLNTGITE